MSLIDNPKLRTLVAQVLDEAIKTVAEKEFKRLCSATHNDAHQISTNVSAALNALGKLQDGVEPKYNEWVALFYLTWYQPRQINMALKILRQFYENSRHKYQSAGRLFHVIDLGCGALAVQFAMALLATEYHWAGSDVTVIGIDPSEPMRNIGEELWLQFWLNLSNHPNLCKHSELLDLIRSCDTMASSCESFDSFSSYQCSKVGLSQATERSEFWMMAVDVVYTSNKNKIKEAFETIRNQCKLSRIFLTCRNRPDRRDTARFVVGREFECEKKLGVENLWFEGTLPITTEWRSGLIAELNVQIERHRRLLNNSVKWAGGNNTALFFQEY